MIERKGSDCMRTMIDLQKKKVVGTVNITNIPRVGVLEAAYLPEEY